MTEPVESKLGCNALFWFSVKGMFLVRLAKGNVSFCHHLASVDFSHFNLLL